jgi:hypothetical protein
MPAKRATGLPLAPAIFLATLALPPEVGVYAGPLRLSVYRIVLLALLIPMASQFLSGKIKARAFDYLILAHSLLAALALLAYAGIAEGSQTAGIYVIECVGAYLVARCYIRTPQDLTKTIAFMGALVLATLLIAIPESLTGNHLVRETSRQIFGGPGLPTINPRLGLHRAYASFDHPILYGIFSASALGFALYSQPTSKTQLKLPGLRAAGIALACFLSISAGALVAAMIMVALYAWDLATRVVPRRWSILIGFFISLNLIISLTSSRSPVKVFLTYVTFDQSTAYNRLRIWDFGTAEVARHPLLGIGLGEWQRPDWMISGSMDNFWLATAVRYGLPSLLTLAGACALLLYGVGQTRFKRPGIEHLAAGWMTSVLGLSLAGCTVHFWNALFALFCFLLGAGAFMAENDSPALAK